MEAANKLVELSSHAWCLHTEHTRMRTWKKKVFGCGHSGRIQATPAKQRPSPYSGYAGAWGSAQAQDSPPQVPAGYQLTPITQSRSPSPTTATQRGISALRPTEVFQSIHFTRPCTYCTQRGPFRVRTPHCWLSLMLLSLVVVVAVLCACVRGPRGSMHVPHLGTPAGSNFPSFGPSLDSEDIRLEAHVRHSRKYAWHGARCVSEA